MTDRGLPIVDGAPACPFVAFEDDRDGRSQAPDHRHRCFAEPRPAPRALAHQEAYCLSSAFPVCPTFQDWARREAAAARPSASATDRAPAGDAPVSTPLPPLERDPRRQGTDTPPPIPPRRTTQRDWAAPPPWSGDGSPAQPGTAAPAPPEDPWGGASRGLAGSAADRLAGPDPADPVPEAPARAAYPDGDLDADRPDGSASRSAAAAAGTAAAAAYVASRPEDDPHDIASRDPEADDEPDWAQDDLYAARAGGDRAYATPRQPPARGDAGDARPPARASRDQASRRQAQDPSDLFGPAWERPHRYEAYPSLRTRVGLPGLGGIGRVGAAALALVLAALILFFVGPMILGIGGDGRAPGGAVATASPDAEPTAAPIPTEPPAPTPQVYVVAKGDTMSRIAKKFGITVEQLLAANKKIKNPDRIKIGDQITIPVPIVDGGGLGADGSASP